MVSINYATREVNCKIVYYGPGLSGKTTNLQYVHAKVPKKTRGDLISLATDADRTLYFDFLPIDIGNINGLATKFQLYTVPGQVFYNATRKLVLRGVDGLVFVADSQRAKREENIESLNNLKENLLEYGYAVDKMPIVLQYNKCDLPEIMTIEELQKDLNWNDLPYFKAAAVKGHGVFDTLKMITKLVLSKARSTGSDEKDQPDEAALAGMNAASTDKIPVLKNIAKPPESTTAGAAATPAQRSKEGGTVVDGSTVIGGSKASPIPAAQPASQTAIPAAAVAQPPSPQTESTPNRLAAAVVPAQGKQAQTPEHSNIGDIESKLTRVDDEEIGGEITEESTTSEISSSQFADTFEVPKVILMQKSLKIKKKKKRFWLFRLFSRDRD